MFKVSVTQERRLPSWMTSDSEMIAHIGLALADTIQYWAAYILPKHTRAGNDAYRNFHRQTGYQLKKTQKRRLIAGGVNWPNPNFGVWPPVDWVFVGRTQRVLDEGARSGSIAANAKIDVDAGGRVVASVPIPVPHGVKPGMMEELRYVTPEEQAAMGRFLSMRLNHYLVETAAQTVNTRRLAI